MQDGSLGICVPLREEVEETALGQEQVSPVVFYGGDSTAGEEEEGSWPASYKKSDFPLRTVANAGVVFSYKRAGL